MTNPSSRPGRRLRWLPAELFALEFVALTWLASLGEIPVPQLFLGYGTAFLAFAALVFLVRGEPRVPWFWFLAALLLRAPWLAKDPSLSDDVWRYLHDGRAQVAGVNPYRHPPQAEPAAAYAGPEHPRINHPDLPTIYPPAAQLAFRAAIHAGGTLLSWKALLVLFDLAVGVVLLRLLAARGVARGGVALYLFHPLPVIEFAGNGHLDALAILALVTAVWLVTDRTVLSGAALAVSIATKYLALPLAPFFARDTARDKRGTLGVALVATLVLLYLPFLDYPPIGSLGTFARTFWFNGPVFSILSAFGSEFMVRALLGAVLLTVLAYSWVRGADVATATFTWIAAVLLLSPIVHPWYTIWLIPFVALRPRWWAFVWTGTVILPYWVLIDWRAVEVWRLPAWVMVLEYAPVYGLLLGGWLVGWRRAAPATGAAVSEGVTGP